ncbi:hypothetical protein Q8I51_19620, partial [Bacillus velezensis]|nr:hypothetical protein [Bacillus velezensis]
MGGIDEMLKQPEIIVLSARDKIRLCDQVQRLATTIDKRKFTDADLTNISYTLLVGREHMEYRLALLVTSIKELEKKLYSYMAGEEATIDFFQGDIHGNNDILSVFGKEEELQTAIEKLLENKKYGRILDFWTKGISVDWNKMFDQMAVRPRFISLPTYPFAKEKYWVPSEIKQPSAASTNQLGTIHPLVHENTSDLSRQRFTSVLSGTEDFFYSVNESSAYLPESAHLEMARVAAGMSVDTAGASVVIKDVEWHAPIMPDGNVSVNIALYQGEED